MNMTIDHASINSIGNFRLKKFMLKILKAKLPVPVFSPSNDPEPVMQVIVLSDFNTMEIDLMHLHERRYLHKDNQCGDLLIPQF